MSRENDAIEFPDVFIDVLGEQEITSYFDDLRQAARVVELRVKGGAVDYSADGGHDLERCARDWASEVIYSLQIVYSFDGVVWCDTLQRVPDGTRVVRLQSVR